MIEISFSQQEILESEQRVADAAAASWKARPDAGFLRAALAEATWSAVKERAVALQGRYDQLIIVGIGGSSFGARALITAGGGRTPLYLDHIEPATVLEIKSQLGNLKRAHWVFVSKSGGTLETLAALSVVEQWYAEQGLNLAEYSTVVAGEGISGALQKWAGLHQVVTLPSLPDVSGRFSVFTAAGLLPAALAGLNVDEIRKGVVMAEQAEGQVASLVAATLASWRREEWITMVWTYGDRLRPMAGWLQQLWTESLGKKVNRQGRPAPRASFLVPCIGSIDQHSILQQMIEGARDKWVWFWELNSLVEMPLKLGANPTGLPQEASHRTLGQIYLAQSEGTRLALEEVGVATTRWKWKNTDATHLGYAMFLMQSVVAALGECLLIETYNQPGVERGKVITLDLLRK